MGWGVEREQASEQGAKVVQLLWTTLYHRAMDWRLLGAFREESCKYIPSNPDWRQRNPVCSAYAVLVLRGNNVENDKCLRYLCGLQLWLFWVETPTQQGEWKYLSALGTTGGKGRERECGLFGSAHMAGQPNRLKMNHINFTISKIIYCLPIKVMTY